LSAGGAFSGSSDFINISSFASVVCFLEDGMQDLKYDLIFWPRTRLGWLQILLIAIGPDGGPRYCRLYENWRSLSPALKTALRAESAQIDALAESLLSEDDAECQMAQHETITNDQRLALGIHTQVG
jgi:hypothetical protein